MFKWLKRKAIEKTESNIKDLILQLIEVANRAEANIQQSARSNPADMKEVKKLQSKLAIQFCGPIPLEKIKTEFIDPALNKPDISEGAKMAVMHCYHYVSSER